MTQLSDLPVVARGGLTGGGLTGGGGELTGGGTGGAILRLGQEGVEVGGIIVVVVVVAVVVREFSQQ